MNTPVVRVPAADELEPARFFDELRAQLASAGRLVSYYGRTAGGSDVRLTAIVARDDGLRVVRTTLSKDHGHRAMTQEQPCFHIFERELHEQLGLQLSGHPWLKPVRSGAAYPFYSLQGKEVHEVAVGPIHAGVIEPGHFRFMCLGETVHHLEIALGYQHRGAEALLLERDPRTLTPLVETLAGDSSIAHAWAYCGALEALASVTPSPESVLSRLLGLELERIAMHLATLAGLATDIAFLQGASTYGRLRTTAINTSMMCCGSRFGRGWVRPGGARAALSAEQRTAVRSNLDLLKRDLAIINPHFLGARSVRARLRGVGVLRHDQALELGVVGPTARASGVGVDVRVSLPGDGYRRFPVGLNTELGGDCWARAVIRIREIEASLTLLSALVESLPELTPAVASLGSLAPNSLAVAVCEGVRGEVVHCLETDAQGALLHYKVQDPSLRNWFGLALAVRNNEISDFPICNKSFDLSYCGHDL